MKTEPVDILELLKHNTRSSCWIVLHSHVYDVTDFIHEHPGGADLILRHAGADATEDYEQYHAPELVDQILPVTACLGSVDPAKISKQKPQLGKGMGGTNRNEGSIPPLNSLINLDDFEQVAEKNLPANAWAYYSSAAEDEITKDENRHVFGKVYLRPRILRDVGDIDTSTSILGYRCSLPVFVCPAAMAKLAHPDGECAITAAAGHEGLIQVVSTSSSMPIHSVMKARIREDQPVFFQLYVLKNLERTKAMIRLAEEAGMKALWVTVDSPVIGKRERDERVKAAIQTTDQAGSVRKGQEVQGIARTMSSVITPRLSWDDLKWIRKMTSLPLVIKGIQTVEDAILAYQHGVAGIVLSNHGGRSQDTTQPPLLTLLEIRKHAPFLIGGKMEIYLDGGIRRGRDVIKALALGATAVGLGRPFLYSLCGYGELGVRRMVSILRDEVVTNMALAGVRQIQEITPDLVNASKLQRDLLSSARL